MMPSRDAAVTLIGRFIEAVRTGDIPAAEACLAPGYELTYPGPTTFRSVADLLEWAAARYSNPSFHFDSFDFIETSEGVTRVFAQGRFDGQLADGHRFADVRSIDCFDIKDGRIAKKVAWSDMADYLRRRKP